VANPTGGAFTEEFTGEYNRGASDIKLQLRESSGEHNLDALVRGDADVTLSGADTVYSLYQNTLQNQAPASPQIRAIAALHVSALHLLVPDDSSIRGLHDLRGATVGAFHMPILNLLFEPGGGMDPPATWRYAPSLIEVAGLVSERRADAALIVAFYPDPSVRVAIQRGAHLISIEGTAIERIRRQHRLIKRITIPGNMYPGHPAPLHTIGIDTVLVCRSDLAEPIVHDLTKRLFDVLPALAKNYASLRVLDVEEAPATPIPLHEGAARYYREVELLR
jgi:hypothetical protein